MKFIVEGGKPLEGEIKIAGAKNATTKLIIASLLTEEECVFDNFPNIVDAEITLELCRQIGSIAEREGSTLKIKTPVIKNTKALTLSRRNRIPILSLGPLLARVGEAEVPALGGDKIGHRPVDMHIEALTKLGAEIESSPDFYKARTKGLKGSVIEFKFPSVGATENTIFAAVLAEGKTVIKNAAIEPEVIDIIKFLQKMGAIIEIGTNRRITIEGVKKLRGASHHIIPDRNEAVSFACLAIATGGELFVKDAVHDHLITFLNNFKKIGGGYNIERDGIKFFREGKLKGIALETDTHPGFMTDWQQPFSIALTQAEGHSTIHETIYEDRFAYTGDLNLMGAKIKVMKECVGETCRFHDLGFSHSAVIEGPTKLKGAELSVKDLRAGMAHLIAALVAEGESVISGVEEIYRGYENIDERLKGVGAEIKKID